MSFGTIGPTNTPSSVDAGTTRSVQESIYWMGRQIKDLWNKFTETVLQIWQKVLPYLKEGAQKVAHFFRTGPGIAVGAAALGSLLLTLSFAPEIEESRWLKITMRVFGCLAFAGAAGSVALSVVKGPTTPLI